MMSDLAVQLDNVRFGWQADQPVLDIPQLHVASGESVFIRGPSGSGKTTLLSLIGGILRPQSGEVRVLGQALSSLSGSQRDRFRAEHIGFLFQQFNLIPYLSVLDNVLLPCRFAPVRARRAEAGGRDLAAEASRLLARLGMPDAVLSQPVTALSVGQQQRVAAARALMGAPPLLIADEPTSALDADRRDDFLALLQQECREHGTTLLFVSHDRALAHAFTTQLDLMAINRAALESAG